MQLERSGVEELGSGKPCVLTLPPQSRWGLQILFKDLFRFLLVYLLFMIGYASGEPGAPGGLAGWCKGWTGGRDGWRKRCLLSCR